MSSSSSRPIPTVSELAKLFGFREDDPDRYRLVARDKAAAMELMKALPKIFGQESLSAEFISLYLPSLLGLLEERTDKAEPSDLLAALLLAVLTHYLLLPQISRALHRHDNAIQLPSLLLRRFTRYSPSTYAEFETFPYRELIILVSLLTSAAKFGPASKCDFHIDPSLLQDFFRVGSQCLESPLLRDVDPDAMLAPELEANGGTVSPLMFSRMITTSFFLLGLVPVRNEETEAFKKIVMECGRSPGAKELLWCQVEGDGDCKSEGKPKFCSKCLCVAYCSAAHQKADWKRHKLICFRPNW